MLSPVVEIPEASGVFPPSVLPASVLTELSVVALSLTPPSPLTPLSPFPPSVLTLPSTPASLTLLATQTVETQEFDRHCSLLAQV